METKLENLNKFMAFKVSPLQSIVNMQGKVKVIESFKYQLWQVWTVPLVLTWLELISLKHGKSAAANNIALFKFASLPVAIGLSFYFYEKLEHKIFYFDAKFPHAPQSQLELQRDQHIGELKQL
jgi:hypothetical protein